MENNTGLIFKWLKSENASSKETKKIANKIRTYLGLSHREYRKMLSYGREKTKVLERLMSSNQWDKIDFSKIPSKAGLKYRNAFSRRDILAKKYETFMKNENTTVNAKALNPVEIAHKCLNSYSMTEIDRAALDKYWKNLDNYYGDNIENGIAVVDVSGSMSGVPMEAAISMGAYISERGHGPFANHFITFSEHPTLVKFEGVDIVDKFQRCSRADWGYNTNIEKVLDMLLSVACDKNTKPEDIPSRLYIFSDMEFDKGMSVRGRDIDTLFEAHAKKWAACGYQMPQVVFWNLDARTQNIPAMGGRFAYVSGFSMSILKTILSGKDGYDIMLSTLLSNRYEAVN